MFIYEDSHLIAAAESAGDPECECSVRICHESHITECTVYRIVSSVAERHFQLSRHMDFTSDGEQILCRCLRIRLYIECFPFLYSGERAHHDISRIVSAAAPAVDLGIDCFFHEDRNLLRL